MQSTLHAPRLKNLLLTGLGITQKQFVARESNKTRGFVDKFFWTVVLVFQFK